MTRSLLDRTGLLVLVDPARTDAGSAGAVAAAAAAAGAVGVLIGSSFDGAGDVGAVARAVRQAAPGLPIALFPGSAMQLTDAVDLILLLSLVSGRNPQYLIEEHVRAVAFLRQHPVPTLSTAYLLIDGGALSSVEAVTQTRPLPADKPELAVAHVTAARLIGMAAVYLDAGSGAARAIPAKVIAACRAVMAAGAPLFVGGGIHTEEQAAAAREAGATYVVVGTAFEGRAPDPSRMAALAAAVRA